MQELTTIVENPLDVLILGWIDAKSKKTGSEKTRIAYQSTLAGFRKGLFRLGLDLDSKSDSPAQETRPGGAIRATLTLSRFLICKLTDLEYTV